MSSVHMPRAIGNRGKTVAEIDRESFVKSQTISIQKAINIQECAVKEKHARILIIGTHQEHGSSTFWSLSKRLQLQGHPIVCWKFCHVVHKLLRDGHPNAVKESLRYIGQIAELGKLWRHLRDTYGKLNFAYTKLIVQKMQFHRKNSEIPGSLMIEFEQLQKICNYDNNNYYELSIDMLDYMDALLDLYGAVFGSLDMSHANSMTPGGQCRLAPMILCIQDSCQLYDFIVKMLFKLHTDIAPDALVGHRERFSKQYKELKQFYQQSANLQYFKNLIKVPILPEMPPNFLQASELHAHVRPVAVVAEEPDLDARSDSDHQDISDQLIDVSGSWTELDSFNRNGAPSPSVVEEKDRIIDQLRWEISELKRELSRVKAEDQAIIDSINSRLKELEMELNEITQIAESTTNENEMLKNTLKAGEKNTEAVSRLEAMEKVAKNNEEKFTKMKDIYGNLREEHVQLLRKNADVAKQLTAEKRWKEELLVKQQGLQQEISNLQQEKQKASDDLVMASSESAQKLNSEQQQKEMLQLQKELTERTGAIKQLETASQQLEESKRSLQLTLDQCKAELETTKQTQLRVNEEKSSAENRLAERQQDVERLQKELEQIVAGKTDAEGLLHQRQSENEKLRSEIDAANGEKIELQAAKRELETAVASQKNDLQKEKQEHEDSRRELAEKTAAVDESNKRLQQLIAEKSETEGRLTCELLTDRKNVLAVVTDEGVKMFKEALAQADNPHHSTVMCTAEYLLDRIQAARDALKLLHTGSARYNEDSRAVYDAVQGICEFFHQGAESVVYAFATSHSASIEQGEELNTLCRLVGDQSMALLSIIKSEKFDTLPQSVQSVDQALHNMATKAEELLPKIEDVRMDQIGDLVEEEMQQTTKAIEQAAAKIEEMLANSREKQSGLQLEVSEKILDACNNLMKSIKILIVKAKVLQKEIVAQGRGTSSVKEFYKKHHRWTEGLISAAKAVGWGANVLVEAADKVVAGNGKFEELVVCSQEIAASTAQLVVASKVKAPRGSESLHLLAEASKKVSSATGQVVASAKSGSQLIEEIDTLDFSKLTLHQAKRLEMESQVRVLELESSLEKERIRLSDLRKTHYQLAGESEGWETESVEW